MEPIEERDNVVPLRHRDARLRDLIGDVLRDSTPSASLRMRASSSA